MRTPGSQSVTPSRPGKSSPLHTTNGGMSVGKAIGLTWRDSDGETRVEYCLMVSDDMPISVVGMVRVCSAFLPET